MITAKQLQNIGAAVTDLSLEIQKRCGDTNGDGTPVSAMVAARGMLGERLTHTELLALHAGDSSMAARAHLEAATVMIVIAGNCYLAASLLVLALELAAEEKLEDARKSVTQAAKLIGVG